MLARLAVHSPMILHHICIIRRGSLASRAQIGLVERIKSRVWCVAGWPEVGVGGPWSGNVGQWPAAGRANSTS